MKYKVIANPAAGKGTAAQVIPLIERQLQTYGLDFDLTRTERPWHAAELAQQAVMDGYDVVVSAGGDGTCNEVLNGLMRVKNEHSANGKNGLPKLGILCIGRGNDFAFGAGMPLDWQSGCKALVQGRSHHVDIGKISSEDQRLERYFGNGVGVGFDAVVNIQAARSKLRGFLNYLVSTLRTITLYYNAPMMKIECDDVTITQPSIMVSIMNGRRMGGGFLMAPHSSDSDGYLDLCIAHEVSRLTILLMIPRFLKGSQNGHPAIRFVRTRQVTITGLDAPLPTHADGETLCSRCQQLKIELLPSQIEVITSQAAG